MLAVAAVTSLLQRRWPVLCATVVLWGTYAAVVAVPGWNAQFSAFHFATWKVVFELFPVFLVGSCIYLYRDKIPDSGILAALSSAAFLVSFVLPVGSNMPAWSLTSVDLAAVFLVYPLIWLGMHLPRPFKRIGSRNDYSYGIYIYGFPVQQLLAVFGVVSWGYFAFSVLGLLGAIPLAVLSWWVVEKRALRLKTLRLPFRRARRSPVAPDRGSPVGASVEEG
jgi:peptidoglycan/LPS O-acetylase OafA/YrhL